jgi:hypothetical protein
MFCCGMGFGNWRGHVSRPAQDGWVGPRTSGNQAFDEYRAATLQRLEAEQLEFREFLARLQAAKDKAEFDRFMAECRAPSAPQPQA